MANTAALDTHAGKWDAAMRQLLAELDEGRRSGEEEGWVDGATVRAHFRQRAKQTDHLSTNKSTNLLT